jgi:hypothetical protein
MLPGALFFSLQLLEMHSQPILITAFHEIEAEEKRGFGRDFSPIWPVFLQLSVCS